VKIKLFHKIIIVALAGVSLGLLGNLIVTDSKNYNVPIVAPGGAAECIYVNYASEHPECQFVSQELHQYRRGFPFTNFVTESKDAPELASLISYPRDTTHFLGVSLGFIVPVAPWIFNALIWVFLISFIWALIAAYKRFNF
jgi:hypothetical protein